MVHPPNQYNDPCGRPSGDICSLLPDYSRLGGHRAAVPLFDTWQLIINKGTTIATFLMVFLIQNTQNRDGAALQAKLDELIRTTHDARNAYLGIERLPERERENVRVHCEDGESASPSLADR